MSNTSNIKYEFLKTNTRKSFVEGKLDEPSRGGRSQSPPSARGTVESPHSYDSSVRQISLSPPRRMSSPRISPVSSPRGINMPNIQGRRVSFVRPQDIGDPFVNTYTDDGLRGRKKERKQSPPKWAKGKKEWNPDKLMDFWTKAAGGSPSRHATGAVKPTDVIDSFWQSHYGDVCPYKLKLPEKKAIPHQHFTPKPRYVATKHKTNTRTSLALPDISPWKEKVKTTTTTTMPRFIHPHTYSHALTHTPYSSTVLIAPSHTLLRTPTPLLTHSLTVQPDLSHPPASSPPPPAAALALGL